MWEGKKGQCNRMNEKKKEWRESRSLRAQDLGDKFGIPEISAI